MCAEAVLVLYELPSALEEPAIIVLDRRVGRGALMKLSRHFGLDLEWNLTIGSVRTLAGNKVGKQCLFRHTNCTGL